MELFIVGLSHRTAPVSVRERLATVPAELEGRLRRLLELPGVREAAIVSTCNRMEIYGACHEREAALEAVRAHLTGELTGGVIAADESAGLGGHLYLRCGREAVHHLFRVASSLDSLVVGEPQILGQIKDAFDDAVRLGTAGALLGAMFPRAFRVARRVRRDTAIAQQRVSVSSVAVDLARQVLGGFAGRRVLVIGAGKMADLAARALHADGATLAVANRTLARAEELAARLGAVVEPFERLGEAIGRADVVISSTGAREPVVRRSMLADARRARRGRPIVLIDIAVPRDVEPAVAELDGVFLFDIDDLQKVVASNLDDRRQEADRAEALVEEELARFVSSERGRAAGPTIAALRAAYQGVARAEVEKLLGAMPELDDRAQRAVRRMAEGLVAKLLHAPSVALKKESAQGDGVDLVEAAQRLFDLPPIAAVAAAIEGAGADEPGEGEAQPQKKARQ